MGYKIQYRVAAAALLLVVPAVVLGADFRSGDTVTLSSGERLESDLYTGGGTVLVAGGVGGDLYTGAGTVLVSGTVAEDAVVGGGTVTVTGSVGDDLRVVGGTVVVEGDVGGDVLIAGGEVYLNSNIGGSVYVKAGKLILGSRANIAGNLSYSAPQEAVWQEGAAVRGSVSYRAPERTEAGAAVAVFSAFALGKFLMLLAGALFFGLFFKRYIAELIVRARAKPVAEFGRGLVGAILIPIVSALLFVTVVGIPLGVIGLLSYIAALIFVWFVAPILLGALLFVWWKKDGLEVSWQSIVLGALLYTLVDIVPILGSVVQLALILIVFGVVLKMKWEIAQEWR